MSFNVFILDFTGYSIACGFAHTNSHRLGSHAMDQGSYEPTAASIRMQLCHMADGYGYCVTISNLYDILGLRSEYLY